MFIKIVPRRHIVSLLRLAEADDIALDGHITRRSLFKLGEIHHPDVPHRDCISSSACFAVAWPCCPVSRTWRTGAASARSAKHPETGSDFHYALCGRDLWRGVLSAARGFRARARDPHLMVAPPLSHGNFVFEAQPE